jgi:hypothetical protein
LTFPRCPAGQWIAGLLASGLALAAAFPAVTEAAEGSLQEKLLRSKFKRGDYAIYFGWHDPWDWQFDVHAANAYPIGAKVRLRTRGPLRVEGDVSYFRRAEEIPILVSIYQTPEFDSFSVGLSLQYVPRETGFLRPYVGAGPVFVSLANDFLVFRPDVYAAAPGNPDQFVLANWSKLDIGWQTVVGLDLHLGYRVFPFVEYRHQFGELALEAKDIKLGNLSAGGIGLEVSDLETIPEDPAVGGRPYEPRYDWSGPIVAVGLKILF